MAVCQNAFFLITGIQPIDAFMWLEYICIYKKTKTKMFRQLYRIEFLKDIHYSLISILENNTSERITSNL